MRAAIAAVAGLGLMLAGSAQAATDLVFSGASRVIDGDSLEVDGERIRLYGIDAPEADQVCRTAADEEWACGAAATHHLASLIESYALRCLVLDRDRYRRWLAVCWTMEPAGTDVAGQPTYDKAKNLNAQMVWDGMAVRYMDEGPSYEFYERIARGERLGLWAGSFVAPADWRRQKRLGEEGEPSAVPEADL